jgi:hypothetical protein
VLLTFVWFTHPQVGHKSPKSDRFVQWELGLESEAMTYVASSPSLS